MLEQSVYLTHKNRYATPPTICTPSIIRVGETTIMSDFWTPWCVCIQMK